MKMRTKIKLQIPGEPLAVRRLRNTDLDRIDIKFKPKDQTGEGSTSDRHLIYTFASFKQTYKTQIRTFRVSTNTAGNSVLLKYDAASLGNRFQTFEHSIFVSSSSVKMINSKLLLVI